MPLPHEVALRTMSPADYDAVYALWTATEGMGLDPEMDSRSGIAAYLARNGGLSFVACAAGEICGTVLCGTDGRRGYLMHLAVTPQRRGQGIGTALVEAALAALAGQGIRKAHVFVFRTNEAGYRFWKNLGWQGRDDLHMLSRDLSGGCRCC